MLVQNSSTNLDTRRMRTDKMLNGNFSSGEKRKLDRAFDALGEDNVDRLIEGGITIKLKDAWTTEAQSYTAQYLPTKKMLVMSDTRIDKETLVHEFGHALDDLAEPDVDGKARLKSEMDPELQKLHHDYCQRVEALPWYNRLLNWGGGLWSDYATTNVHEYLAEGVRVYASSERGKEKLLRDDPKLAVYVESFLHPTPKGDELGMLLAS